MCKQLNLITSRLSLLHYHTTRTKEYNNSMKYNMKAFVITIMNHDSLETSWRCIESGCKYDLDIKRFKKQSLRDEPLTFLKQEGMKQGLKKNGHVI